MSTALTTTPTLTMADELETRLHEADEAITAAVIAAELLASHLARVEPEYASHAAIAATNVAEAITKNLREEFSNEQISAAVEDARELRGFIRLAEQNKRDA